MRTFCGRITFGMDSKSEVKSRKNFFSDYLFSAVAQERKKFGPIGWCVPYGFTQSDLIISAKQLDTFLEKSSDGEIPLKGLKYSIGQCNFGGRVTDDRDRRCLERTLEVYFCSEILADGYSFSPSSIYYAPPDGSKQDYIEYISGLPMNDDPEVFGLHSNAEITKNMNETFDLFSTVLLTQPRAAASGESAEEIDAISGRDSRYAAVGV